MSNMIGKISSFAILDLETTTLPSLNFNKANITEISIHGINAEYVKNAQNCNSPRINHKLTLLFNPLMMIHPESETITALDNYMLENESSFDHNAAHVIINFLKHLRQPVCLVAHNGDNFDFPVLKHALSNLGLELPNDIVCVDSYVAIKHLEEAQEQATLMPLPDTDSGEEFREVCTPSKTNKTSIQCTEENSIKPSEIPGKNESLDDWQKFNETTPQRPPHLDNIERKRKRIVKSEESTPIDPKSRRSLFTPNRTKPGHFKLVTIYERLFGHPPQVAHHAEADVVTLKKVMLGLNKPFVNYAEENAKPFSEVKKLGAR